MEKQVPSHPLILARAEQHYGVADLLMKFGGNSSIELEYIVQELYNAMSFTPNSCKIYYLLSETYIRILDYTSSIACLRYVIKSDVDHIRARHLLFEMLVLSGLEIFRQGRYYSRACYRFSEALKLESSRPKIWTFKAVCHVHLHEYKLALESVSRAIHTSVEPTADLYVMRAKLLWAEGLVDQGSRDIHSARAIDKTHPEVLAFTERSFAESRNLYKSANKHLHEERYKEAMEDVRMALMLTPEDIKLHILLSQVQRSQGLLDDAYATLQKIKHLYDYKSIASGGNSGGIPLPLEISRQINLVYNDMALKLSLQGEYEKAIILFKKLIESERKISNDNNIDYRFFVNLGDCYRALENCEKAIINYKIALRILPADWDTKVRLSMTYYLLGCKLFNNCQYIQADDEMTMAIQYNPKISEYYAVRGKARFYVGRYSEAHEDFLKAVELNPENSEIQDRLRQFGSDPLHPGVKPFSATSALDPRKDTTTQNNINGNGGRETSKSANALLESRSDQSLLNKALAMSTGKEVVVPSTEDQIEMLLNAKYMRTTRSLKNRLENNKYLSKHYHTSINSNNSNNPSDNLKFSKTDQQHINYQLLLPKLNPSLASVIESESVVVEARKTLNTTIYDTVGRSMKRDPLWSMMTTAKDLAASTMKPKHLKKKNYKSAMPTTAAALKRASLEHSKQAVKTAIVAGIVTTKNDDFIKAITEPNLNLKLKKSVSGSENRRLSLKVLENG